MKLPLSAEILGRLISSFVRLVGLTLRIRHLHADRIEEMNRTGRRYVLAFWHNELVLMFYSRWSRPMTVMSSRSRDGQISGATMGRFGVNTTYGSSTRGGSSALREMLRLARSGHNVAFTPDGPRGPRHEVKAGVILAAQWTGNPIVPVRVVMKKKRLLRSWDRMEIPHLFTRVIFVYGEPLQVPREMAAGEVDHHREELRLRMEELASDRPEDFEEIWRRARK